MVYSATCLNSTVARSIPRSQWQTRRDRHIPRQFTLVPRGASRTCHTGETGSATRVIAIPRCGTDGMSWETRRPPGPGISAKVQEVAFMKWFKLPEAQMPVAASLTIPAQASCTST